MKNNDTQDGKDDAEINALVLLMTNPSQIPNIIYGLKHSQEGP